MIDIVIPTWNHSHLTIQCLEMIAMHTIEPYRIIWVDDGSTEEHIDVVKKRLSTLGLLHVAVLLPENRGPTVAINEGLRTSKEDFIVVLNNDILVTGGWLGKLLFHMEATPDIGIIAALDGNGCTNWEKVRERKNIVSPDGKSRTIIPVGDPVDYFAHLPPLYYEVPRNIPFCSCMIRRDALEQVGLLDETMRVFGQDNDFNERMKIVGWKKAVAVDCYVRHLEHQTVKSVRKIKNIRVRDKEALRIARERRRNEQ